MKKYLFHSENLYIFALDFKLKCITNLQKNYKMEAEKIYKVIDAAFYSGNVGINAGYHSEPEYIGKTGTIDELRDLGRYGIIIDIECKAERWRTYSISPRAKHVYLQVEPL